jgi:hypothetical protein
LKKVECRRCICHQLTKSSAGQRLRCEQGDQLSIEGGAGRGCYQ